MEILTPHLQRSIILSNKLAENQLYLSSLENVINQLSSAVLISDENQKLVFANNSAEYYFQNNSISLNRNGCITLKNNAENNKLNQLLHNTTNCEKFIEAKSSNAIRVQLEFDNHLIIMAFPLSPYIHSNIISGFYNNHVARQCLIFIIDPSKQDYADEEIIRAAFGLTAAEARLAKSLYEGSSVNEHAEINQITKTTARNQLSSVFQKMDISKQSELVKQLTKIFGILKTHN